LTLGQLQQSTCGWFALLCDWRQISLTSSNEDGASVDSFTVVIELKFRDGLVLQKSRERSRFGEDFGSLICAVQKRVRGHLAMRLVN
jgi:hypothetical protein